MTANELRIGNWVNVEVRGKGLMPIPITDILSKPEEAVNMIGDRYDYPIYYTSELRPIELTPEILEAAGWEAAKYYSDSTSFKYGAFFWNENGWFEIELSEGHKILSMDIKYLHQLQNLFYSLTGTELEINLETVKA